MFEIAVTVSTVLWLCWFIYWNSSKKFFSLRRTFLPAVRQHILIDIYLINKLLYNLNLVQVEQCTKLNHELHRGVTFFHRLSVKRGRQYMYSTTIFPLKTQIYVKKQSRQIQTRDVEGPFDHIRTCIENYLFRRHIAIQSCNMSFSLKNMYKHVWLTKLENEALFRKGKLRTFYSFKPLFQKEVYLDILNNRSHQQALTQLRIGAHKLEIENGRYSKKPIDDTTCKHCFQNQVEDEMHFIFDCSFYNSERVTFCDYIRDTIPNFACLNSFDKMVWLMTCENKDKDIVNQFAGFVSTYFTWRKTG